MATHPRLNVYGGSLRGNLWGGVTNFEGAYWDSLDDQEGADPNVPNSQVRGLVGYERELFRNFTAGIQYYVEWTLDYDRLVADSPWPQFEPPERRHLFTTRLTRRLLQQTLTLSLFRLRSALGWRRLSEAGTNLQLDRRADDLGRGEYPVGPGSLVLRTAREELQRVLPRSL